MGDGDKNRLGPRIVRPAAGKLDGMREDRPLGPGRRTPDSGSRDHKGIPATWRTLVQEDHLPALTDGFSLITEQFRLMRVKLDSMEMPGGGPPRVLAFTSTIPGEGKTCNALNTSLAAAQEVGRRICFVECDLRRRRVESLLQDPPRIGLSDLLQEKVKLKDVLLHMDRPPGLSLILAGSAPPNPVELLGSGMMQRLVSHLRQSYDLVILDTPPALNFADASRLGPLVDGYVLVVRSGKAPRDAVLKVYGSLSKFHVAGVILNDVREASRSDYSYYYRQYTESASREGRRDKR